MISSLEKAIPCLMLKLELYFTKIALHYLCSLRSKLGLDEMRNNVIIMRGRDRSTINMKLAVIQRAISGIKPNT